MNKEQIAELLSHPDFREGLRRLIAEQAHAHKLVSKDKIVGDRKVVSIQGAAEVLGCAYHAVPRLALSGKVEKAGRGMYFLDSLQEYLTSRTPPPGAITYREAASLYGYSIDRLLQLKATGLVDGPRGHGMVFEASLKEYQSGGTTRGGRPRGGTTKSIAA